MDHDLFLSVWLLAKRAIQPALLASYSAVNAARSACTSSDDSLGDALITA